MLYFWVVLGLFYLVLSLVVWKEGRPILKDLLLLKGFDALRSIDENGREVGLESTLYKAYRGILITDIVGFALAAIAAVIAAF